MADGHLNKCKGCVRGDVIKNRKAKPEHYREYESSRNSLPHRVEARAAYQETDAFRESRIKANKKFYEENKDKRMEAQRESRVINRGKHRAREMVAYAVSKGTLLKPDCCETCGSSSSLEGHHCDYNKPLEVMWLCSECHGKWHREHKPIEPF